MRLYCPQWIFMLHVKLCHDWGKSLFFSLLSDFFRIPKNQEKLELKPKHHWVLLITTWVANAGS